VPPSPHTSVAHAPRLFSLSLGSYAKTRVFLKSFDLKIGLFDCVHSCVYSFLLCGSPLVFLFLRVSCPLQHRVEDSEVISTSTERRSSRREICDSVQSSHCSRYTPDLRLREEKMAMAMTAVRRFSRSQLQASYRALEAPGLVFSSTRFSSSVRIASSFCPPFFCSFSVLFFFRPLLVCNVRKIGGLKTRKSIESFQMSCTHSCVTSLILLNALCRRLHLRARSLWLRNRLSR
jgi:hypothetical protein